MTITELQYSRKAYSELLKLSDNFDEYYPLIMWKDKVFSKRFDAAKKHIDIMTEEVYNMIYKHEKQLIK